MKITDIPIEARYYGNAERTQGREVREGKFDGATEAWCPGWATPIGGHWVTNPETGPCCGDCYQFWSRPIDVGEGWELVGLDEVYTETSAFEFRRSQGHWSEFGHAVTGFTIRRWLTCEFPESSIIAFRRRKKPEHAQSGAWISVKERRPTEADANSEGNVWWWNPNRSVPQDDCWYCGEQATHWMHKPWVAPEPPAPAKTDAEAAWENYRRNEKPWICAGEKDSFLAGYAAGKEAK